MRYIKNNTNEFLGLAGILDLDVGLSALSRDFEGEIFDISLHFGVVELATDETLGVKDTRQNVKLPCDCTQEVNLRVVL